MVKQWAKEKVNKAPASENKEAMDASEKLRVATDTFERLNKLGKPIFKLDPSVSNKADQLLKGEIKQASKFQKDYTMARLDFDGKRNDLEGAQSKSQQEKAASLQEKLDLAKRVYDDALEKFLMAVQDLDSKKDGVHEEVVQSLQKILGGLQPGWKRPEGLGSPVNVQAVDNDDND